MSSASKHATVEDGQPTPPPLPNEPLPAHSATPVDQPIHSIGDNDGEDETSDDGDEQQEEEWDPAAESTPGGASSKGKAKATAGGEASAVVEADPRQPWQAVWSAEQNAWYFWNTQTGEVTWTNPLDPNAPSSSAPPAPNQPPLPAGRAPSKISSDPTFGLPPDIDPDLAHLLPPEQRGFAQSGDQGVQKGLFNSRTGRFTANNYAYTVDHLDEYNRAKRMNSHYFDVDAWERDKAEEHAKRKRDDEAGVDREKKITKKDMERFKKKAAEKKFRNQAWLRD